MEVKEEEAGCSGWTDSIFKRKELHLTPSNFWTVYLGGHGDKIPAHEQASRADKNPDQADPVPRPPEPEGMQCPLSNQSLSVILIIFIDVGFRM